MLMLMLKLLNIYSELYFKTRDIVKPLSVRELKATYVGKLVSVSGVVIRCTEVKPLASVITYTCDSCGSETYQQVLFILFFIV